MYSGRDTWKRTRKTSCVNVYREFLEVRSFCIFFSAFFKMVNVQNGKVDFALEQILMCLMFFWTNWVRFCVMKIILCEWNQFADWFAIIVFIAKLLTPLRQNWAFDKFATNLINGRKKRFLVNCVYFRAIESAHVV